MLLNTMPVVGYAGALGEALRRHKLTKGPIVVHILGATDTAEALQVWGPEVCREGSAR
jgi:hypothetical protein